MSFFLFFYYYIIKRVWAILLPFAYFFLSFLLLQPIARLTCLPQLSLICARKKSVPGIFDIGGADGAEGSRRKYTRAPARCLRR